MLSCRRLPLSPVRQSLILVVLLLKAALLGASTTSSGELTGESGTETKRVLVVHSFANATPPFTTASSAFETELMVNLGAQLDLDEVSLNFERYAGIEMEEALIDFMRQRRTKWQPDLVVPIGSPAARFVAEHRVRLFTPTIPVIYTGLDQRRLPTNALAYNATFVGHYYDLSGLVEDILQIAPQTRNIAVLIGASPVEQLWKEIAFNEYKKFTNRVNFTWFDDLSFSEMLERSKTLPDNSFLLMILLVRDAKGVSLNANEALKRIHQVANAPINGIFSHQLGHGIVGGRLYDEEAVARASAQIAIQTLNGEPVMNSPPKVLPPSASYDGRELKRWKIDEKRLPQGSTVIFRDESLWQKYPGRIITAFGIFLFQAFLIVALVLTNSKRKRVETDLRESQKSMTMAANAASMGMLVWDTSHAQMWTSEKWREIYGYGLKEEIRFEDFLRRIHPDDLEVVERAIRNALDKKTEFLVQHRAIRLDQQVRWISMHGRVEPRRNDAVGLMGVAIDITEHVNAESAAREVSGRLINAQEEERKRIARDLHDDFNQRLAMLSLDADLLGRINHEPDAQPLIEEITTQVKSLASEIHKLSYQLHPAKLEQLGLMAATRTLCSEQSRVWSMPIDFVQAGVPRDLNPDTALVIYRITQEALHNIGKHSKATHAQVELTRENDAICLFISDDGQGFDLNTVSHHQGLGLLGMRERVRLAHGHMDIQSAPGKGTTIEVSVPMTEKQSNLKDHSPDTVHSDSRLKDSEGANIS